ncbi:MAG: hypothetical protein LC109_09550, partial [Bacteroidia bacterium]|nr:hypothetical protein [Bacteroidia bacterium]
MQSYKFILWLFCRLSAKLALLQTLGVGWAWCGLQMCQSVSAEIIFLKCGGKIFKTFLVVSVDVSTVAIRLQPTFWRLAKVAIFTTK